MEVSKLTLNGNMMEHLNNPMLSRKKKHKLRVEAIKSQIREKPTGTIISITELMGPLNMSVGGGWAFVNSLVKRKVITKNPSPENKGYSWSIPGDVRTVKPTKKITDVVVEKPERPLSTPLDVNQIIDKAKKFAWEHNSDSLRDFINLIQEG